VGIAQEKQEHRMRREVEVGGGDGLLPSPPPNLLPLSSLV